MSGDGFWLTQHAKVMPPLDAKVQAFWLSDHPLPINSASPSAPPSWSKLASLHEWETKALSLAAPGRDVRILLPCNSEKQLDKTCISSCLGEADDSRFLYAFSGPLRGWANAYFWGKDLSPISAVLGKR
jgi:hypothetical protein